MLKFTHFLGVDQTGATDTKGKPRPLPVALIFQSGAKWKLVFSRAGKRLEISRVTREELQIFFSELPYPDLNLSTTALIMDSVFGLPESSWPRSRQAVAHGSEGLFQLFQKAASFEYAGKHFGRDTAEAFFGQFLSEKNSRSMPQRLCETASGANSVFRTKPFQRNIGCGTFRIWKDLGSAPQKWFHIWGFDQPTSQPRKGPWIFEAYPTLFWKKILGFPSRSPLSLPGWLQTKAPKNLIFDAQELSRLSEDPDLCDSVVLALGAWILQSRGEIWEVPSFPSLQKEGWILGLPL